MKCDYGCNQDGTFVLKNGKNCCSQSPNKCVAKRAADSMKKRGVKPIFRNGHPRGMAGKTAWNAGKSFSDVMGDVAAEVYKKKIAQSLSGFSSYNTLTDDEKAICNEKHRNNILTRYANGWMPKAGRCKKIKYTSPIAGEVFLDGTWELLVAQFFDKQRIDWQRNKNRFAYHFDGKDRFYTPDFYIKPLNLYVEIKGYETEKDKAKWTQFPHELKILRKADIKIIKDGGNIDFGE